MDFAPTIDPGGLSYFPDALPSRDGIQAIVADGCLAGAFLKK
jgi:hypothetical protein